jgi:hypothetical protein
MPRISRSWIAPALAALLATTANAQSPAAGSPIVIGQRHQLSSTALSAPVTYFVHTPKLYERTEQRYPLVILLDGDEHFAHVSASTDFLAESGRIPPLILVGVTTLNRYVNLTPPLTDSAPNDPNAPHADGYLRFISDELIPEIDRAYRTRPYRVLIGHSNAGLFVVYALLERSDVFDGYVAVSPSIEPEDEPLLAALPPFFQSHKTWRGDVYLAIANEAGTTLANAWRLSGAFAKDARLVPGLRWRLERYPDDDHGTVSLRAMEQGLRSVFDGWLLKDADAVAIYDLGGLPALEKHYAEVSERMGYSIPVPRTTYSSVVRALRQRNRTNEAKLLLEQAIAAYPDDPEFYFVMGQEYFFSDRPRALEYFTKSLEASPTAYRGGVDAYKADASKLLPEVRPPAQVLISYAGTYRAANDSRTIRAKAGALVMSSSTGDCELRFLSEQRFYCGDEQGTFDKDRGGRVRSLTLRAEDYRFSLVKSR